MCSADTCQLKGGMCSIPLVPQGLRDTGSLCPLWWHGLQVHRASPALSLLPAGFPQHSVFVCARFAGDSSHNHMIACIKSEFLNVSTSYFYSRRNMKFCLDKISKIHALLLNPSHLWTDLYGKFSVCHRETTFTSTRFVLWLMETLSELQASLLPPQLIL